MGIKRICGMMIGALLLLLMPMTALAVEITDDFCYEVVDGQVIILGYEGQGEMNIPESIGGYPVSSVGDYVCRGNNVISAVVIPSTVRSIGRCAFAECETLTRVIFADGCLAIGADSFRDCPSLKAVTMPQTVERIEENAFSGCPRLGKVSLPMSLTEIGVDTFSACENLRFSCGDNETARSYAERYGIPTGFYQTKAFMLVLIATSCAVMLIGWFAVSHLAKRSGKLFLTEQKKK